MYFRYNGMIVSKKALHALSLREIELSMEEGRKHCEFPCFVMEEVFAEVTRKLKGYSNEAWLQEAVRWFRILSMRKLVLYDGVLDVLAGLKNNGKKIYLLTNGQKTFIEMEMKSLGIYHYFDGIAISSVARVSKPDPLFYSYLSEKYDVDLSSALMIGNDTQTDMEVVRRIGIDSCYLHTASSPALNDVDGKWRIGDGDLRKIPGWRQQ